MKTLVDKMEAYTYNKSTVWFLSTPIQYLQRSA